MIAMRLAYHEEAIYDDFFSVFAQGKVTKIWFRLLALYITHGGDTCSISFVHSSRLLATELPALPQS